VSASLEPAEVEAFDHEHAELLSGIANDQFDIPHLIALHVYRKP
jgi:hypothetical protein